MQTGSDNRVNVQWQSLKTTLIKRCRSFKSPCIIGNERFITVPNPAAQRVNGFTAEMQGGSSRLEAPSLLFRVKGEAGPGRGQPAPCLSARGSWGTLLVPLAGLGRSPGHYEVVLHSSDARWLLLEVVRGQVRGGGMPPPLPPPKSAYAEVTFPPLLQAKSGILN